jgi:hypothetical protein
MFWSDEDFELRVLPAILSNERACRIYLDNLITQGVRIRINGHDLHALSLEDRHKVITHEEAIDVLIRIYAELKKNPDGVISEPYDNH